MPAAKRTTRELEAAFREAGFGSVSAEPDCVRVRLDEGREFAVLPVSVGHGRPQELRNVLARYWDHGNAPYVTATLIANHFTSGALSILREEGVNYLDDSQFVFRNREPFVVIRQDRKARQSKSQSLSAGLGGRTGIAIQAMLLEDQEWWQVTDLAEKAGVAAGTAQTALARLEQLGLVEAQGAGPKKLRRLSDKGEVLVHWARAATAERAKVLAVFIPAQGPLNLARSVTHRLHDAGITHAVTGACGALLVAPHVTDVRRCEVWVEPTVSDAAILDAVGVESVEKGGNVTFLRARSDAPLYARRGIDGVEVANPLRLYADLLEDPQRGEEQAEFLRETVLGV